MDSFSKSYTGMEFNISIFIGGVQKGSKKVDTPCLIGRGKDAKLTVAHPAMSRKHCEIFEDSGKLFLQDGGSLNGTTFKGQFVEKPVELPFGGEFSIGELTFRIAAVEPDPREINEDVVGKSTVIEPLASINIPENVQANESVSPVKVSAQDKPVQGSAAPGPEKDGNDPKPASPVKSKKVSPKEVRIIT
ncbi:MAG: FHA domain-containing protein [Planctomycetaceae bacterium]|nr:FHA domain-containing protein [Planctomycetaceae bacterium]